MRERVEGARVGRMATVDAEGRSHLVPICFALEGGHALLGGRREAEALEAVEARREHPRPLGRCSTRRPLRGGLDEALVGANGRAGQGARRGRERTHALELLGAKYDQYRAEPPTGAVIAIRVERWRGWAAT